jgi:chromosome segregation ATPase
MKLSEKIIYELNKLDAYKYSGNKLRKEYNVIDDKTGEYLSKIYTSIEQLEKENEELKSEFDNIDFENMKLNVEIEDLNKENKQLKQQIEKMKCCDNCKKCEYIYPGENECSKCYDGKEKYSIDYSISWELEE